jgi:hypothetical protein
MGYSHSWFRPRAISDSVFHAISADFQKLILPLADAGVPLAGWDGRNEAEINDECIRFNGVRNCGHRKVEGIYIPYPADESQGVGSGEGGIIGPWHGVGTELRHRCCDGECCHDTFFFPKVMDEIGVVSKEPDTLGLRYNWTKTAFKPYDVAVTAALLIAKRHMREKLVIHSNGRDPQWADAKDLCQRHLGYGAWFGIVEDPRIEIWPGPNGASFEHEVRALLLVEMDPAAFHV